MLPGIGWDQGSHTGPGLPGHEWKVELMSPADRKDNPRGRYHKATAHPASSAVGRYTRCHGKEQKGKNPGECECDSDLGSLSRPVAVIHGHPFLR